MQRWLWTSTSYFTILLLEYMGLFRRHIWKSAQLEIRNSNFLVLCNKSYIEICNIIVNYIMLNKYKWKLSWCDSSFPLNTPGYNFLFSHCVCTIKTNISTIYGLARSSCVRYGFENVTFNVVSKACAELVHHVYVTHN